LVTTVGASLLRRLVRGRYRIVVVATDARGQPLARRLDGAEGRALTARA